MYDAFVTIKMPSRIAYVDIMKTEDAIRIIEINEPPVFLVNSTRIWWQLSTAHTTASGQPYLRGGAYL